MVGLMATEQDSFEEHVRNALDRLPAQIAQALENVAVVVEEEDPADPDLFGLWEADEFMPDKITIFRRPLVESFSDPAELEREIRITVLHELGHYFGLDEDQIRKLGYE
jgi:predicted Zn-dependent protease with MMP-like domain